MTTERASVPDAVVRIVATAGREAVHEPLDPTRVVDAASVRIVAAALAGDTVDTRALDAACDAFADDPDGLVKTARKQYHKVFVQLSDTDLRNALAEGPVHAWRNIVLIDAMGRAFAGERFGFEDKSGYDPANIAALESGGTPPMPDKRDVHASAINSVIVISRAVTRGKSAAQIADYAAMRTLTGARPPAKGSIASASILSLFDDDVSPVPLEISDMDLGLLGGLYALRTPTENAAIELDRISKKMVSTGATDRK